MCCADAAFRTQCLLSVFYGDSGPSVQFWWWESGTCSRKTHCCPGKRALSKPFLQKPFWDQEHWQAWSWWVSCIDLTPLHCNMELSLKTDLKTIQSWCDLQNVQPPWTSLILNVAFCHQGSISRQRGSCGWKQEVRLIDVCWRGYPAGFRWWKRPRVREARWTRDTSFYGDVDSIGKEEKKKGEDS